MEEAGSKARVEGRYMALLRKRTKEEWTDKLETLPENWFWKEAGCRKDSSTLVGRITVNGGRHRKHRIHYCPEWNEVRREIPEAFRKWEHKARDSKEEWKWQRALLRILSVNWGTPAEGFKGHVATDGSLLVKVGSMWSVGGAIGF